MKKPKMTAAEKEAAKKALAPARKERARDQIDIANAARFAEQHRERLKYCEALGGWLIWDGKAWAADPQALKVMLLAIETARSLFDDVAQAESVDEKKAASRNYFYANRLTALRAMIAIAKSELEASADTFDRDPFALNCLNGTVDLRNGKIKPHDPNAFITKLNQIDFDPRAIAPRWETFLEEVLPDRILRAYIQRAVGYSLSADQREECMFVTIGSGANGKGVLFDILRAAIGPYGIAGRPELLMRKKWENANNEDLALLRGQRLVEVSETSEAHELNESQVKNLTGQDALRASFKYQSLKATEFRATHTLWLRTNNAPIIHGADYAIWRRLKLITFGVQFVPEFAYRAAIKTNPTRAADASLRILDSGLRDKLRKEVKGVLAWAIKGAIAWWNRGEPDLREPAIVTLAVEQFRSDMDRLGQFLDECCKRIAGAKTPSKALYARYRMWALEKGLKPWAAPTFGVRLSKAGFKGWRTTTEKGHEGLMLAETASDTTARSLRKMGKVIPIDDAKRKRRNA